jgi:hypothetical protein
LIAGGLEPLEGFCLIPVIELPDAARRISVGSQPAEKLANVLVLARLAP